MATDNPLNASKILFDLQENQRAFDAYAKLLIELDNNATKTLTSISRKSNSIAKALKKVGENGVAASKILKSFAESSDLFDKQEKNVRQLALELQALKKIEKENNIEREVAKKSQKEINAVQKEYAKNLKLLTSENKKLAKEVDSITKKYDAQTKSQKAADNSLEKLRLETKEAEKSFKRLEGSIDANNKEVLTARNKFVALKNQLNKTNAEIREDVKTVNVAKDSYRSWEAAVNKASKELKELPNVLGKNAKKAEQLKNVINQNKNKLKQFDKSIGNFQRNVGNYRSALDGVGVGAIKMAGALGLAYGATEALAKIATFAFNKFRAFEFSMAQVKSISGATASEFKALETDAKRLGASTKFTADQVAGLQLEFAKKGFKTDQIINATEATLNLAEATGEDLAASADVASSTLKGFGLNASETKRVTDIMAKSFSSSSLDLEKFKESMKLVAPIAKTAGISLERATADIGKLADVGISGSSSGTALRKIYSELATEGSKLSKSIGFTVKNSKDAEKAFKILSKQSIGLSEAQKFVGVNAKSAFLALIENSEGAAILTKELENSQGAALAMANVMRDTLQGSLDSLNSASESLAITLFDGVDGAFRGLVDTLTSVLQGLNSFFGGIEGGIKTQEQFTKSISDEKAQIEFLFASLNSTTLSHKERLEVVDKINKQYGEYLPNLITEKDSHIQNAAAQDLVIKGKIKELILIREKDQIETILVKRLEAQQRLAAAKLVIDKDIAIQAKERKKQTDATINGVFKSEQVISRVDEAASAISIELQKVNEEAANATQEVKDLNNQLRKIEGIAIPKDETKEEKVIRLAKEAKAKKIADAEVAEKLRIENLKKGAANTVKIEKDTLKSLEKLKLDAELKSAGGTNSLAGIDILEERAKKKQIAELGFVRLGAIEQQTLISEIEFEFEQKRAKVRIELAKKETGQISNFKDAIKRQEEENKKQEADQNKDLLKSQKDALDKINNDNINSKNERINALALEQRQVNNLSNFLKRNIKDERIRLAIELARLSASFRIAKLKQKENGQTGIPNSFKNLSFLNNIKLPSFAKGIIDRHGEGTETSDSNIIRISNRESVITAKATKASKGILNEIQTGRITDAILPTLSAKETPRLKLESNIINTTEKEFDYDKLAIKIGEQFAKNMPQISIEKQAAHLILSEKNGNYIREMRINAKALKYEGF